MIEDNIKVVENFYNAYNAHDFDAMDRLRAAGFRSDSTAGTMNIEQVRKYDQNLLTAFPDLNFEITLTVAEANYVAVHWIARGTHRGIFRTPSRVAVPPTGRQVEVPGSQTFEVKNGKITRNWFFTDMLGLLTQMGLMPQL